MWVLIALLILLGIFVIATLPAMFPPRSVGPPAQIISFDAHPRHVCRNDLVTATWQGVGDSGTFAAATWAPIGVFYSESLDRSRISTSRSTFPADVEGDIDVTLSLVRTRGSAMTTDDQFVTIKNYTSPNARIVLLAQTSFTPDPRPGWIGRQVYSSDPTVDLEDWSPRIAVARMRYRGAGEVGEARGREVIVTWHGTSGTEIATLSPAQPEHVPSLVITVVGQWELFVPAGPTDGQSTSLPVIGIELWPRCVAS
jgi:hypothetical protein